MALTQFEESLKVKRIQQVLITDPQNIAYLIGQHFEVGERFIGLLFQPNKKPALYLNKLFHAAYDPRIEVIQYMDSDPVLSDLNQRFCEGNIGIDGHCPASVLFSLMEQSENQERFFNASYLIDRLRAIKSSKEQQLMQAASLRNDAIMERVRKILKPGISELEIADQIKAWQAEDGLSGISFAPIVSINEHIADPHASPTSRILKENDAIVIDMGGIYQGYCSDMTRTFYLRNTPDDIYNVCLQANLAAIAAVKAGVRFSDIDKAARDVIDKAGYGEYFTHRTGHGIGHEVHEPYDVSSTNCANVEAGMIFSIEPGIYLPQKTGVRIEDLVIATEEGCIVLNNYPKDQPCILS